MCGLESGFSLTPREPNPDSKRHSLVLLAPSLGGSALSAEMDRWTAQDGPGCEAQSHTVPTAEMQPHRP